MSTKEWQFPAEAHKEALVKSFDETTQSLKVTVANTPVQIDVSAFTDSIKIGDGSGTNTTITTVGAKKALDVNVADITLDAANDSVAIKNGSNQLAVNSDGSVNARAIGFSSINVSTQIMVGTSSTTLLILNNNRRYVHIINNSSNRIFIQYGTPAEVNRGIKIPPGAMWTISGYEVYLGQITAISETPSTAIDILEGT